MRIFSLFLLGLFFACGANDNPTRKTLTDNGEGKFWDLIYQSDIYGIQHPPFPRKNSLSESSIYFDNETMIRYYVFDSNKVIDYNKISGDIKLSYEYELNSDTLMIGAQTWIVSMLSQDSLILVGLNGSKAKRIYHGVNKSARVVVDSMPY